MSKSARKQRERTIFYVSDGTAITAETIGQSLITQFSNYHFTSITIPYVDTADKAHAVAKEINTKFQRDQIKPIVFATLINPQLKAIIEHSHCVLYEFLSNFLPSLAHELSDSSEHTVGKLHTINSEEMYQSRISAINFTLACDDGGQVKNYHQADVIILGTSRSGKTPACLYLALQFGLKSANYPLVEEDLTHPEQLDFLKEHLSKLCGLTIQANTLQKIRSHRWPKSQYASLEQCRWEIQKTEAIYRHFNIPCLDSTRMSIEEIATKILDKIGINRQTLFS